MLKIIVEDVFVRRSPFLKFEENSISFLIDVLDSENKLIIEKCDRIKDIRMAEEIEIEDLKFVFRKDQNKSKIIDTIYNKINGKNLNKLKKAVDDFLDLYKKFGNNSQNKVNQFLFFISYSRALEIKQAILRNSQIKSNNLQPLLCKKFLIDFDTIESLL